MSGAVYVLCAAVVAMLPIRRQYWPAGIMLLAAPLLLAFIGYQHGWFWFVLGMLAFLSMFRNPLRYLWKKSRGEHVELPE
ncbi:uncharacterized protein DUF2484 [Planktotalea frisia]|jgi:hypothetical protein|uniref:UDP-N-acetylmuramate--alanine ligase n=2 Tax=Planktotalea frisia TaxID=696762 RepID=A0A1L9P2K5_9RHOB|nr:hypothetical protein PFRI_01570 [Planktotalea frisia]PZX33348.1 uncharacterized protein DUF2484 [Planktotalea frisia]